MVTLPLLLPPRVRPLPLAVQVRGGALPLVRGAPPLVLGSGLGLDLGLDAVLGLGLGLDFRVGVGLGLGGGTISTHTCVQGRVVRHVA